MKISRKKLRTLILREISMGVRGPTVPKSVPMPLEERIKLALVAYNGPMLNLDIARFLKVDISAINELIYNDNGRTFETGGVGGDTIGLPDQWDAIKMGMMR
tara:strand:- start:355 stop:660 length:306 start_codon:yes stop_codon:yes gene_type:complete